MKRPTREALESRLAHLRKHLFDARTYAQRALDENTHALQIHEWLRDNLDGHDCSTGELMSKLADVLDEIRDAKNDVESASSDLDERVGNLYEAFNNLNAKVGGK